MIDLLTKSQKGDIELALYELAREFTNLILVDKNKAYGLQSVDVDLAINEISWKICYRLKTLKFFTKANVFCFCRRIVIEDLSFSWKRLSKSKSYNYVYHNSMEALDEIFTKEINVKSICITSSVDTPMSNIKNIYRCEKMLDNLRERLKFYPKTKSRYKRYMWLAIFLSVHPSLFIKSRIKHNRVCPMMKILSYENAKILNI